MSGYSSEFVRISGYLSEWHATSRNLSDERYFCQNTMFCRILCSASEYATDDPKMPERNRSINAVSGLVKPSNIVGLVAV